MATGHAGLLLAVEQGKEAAEHRNRQVTLIKFECIAGVRLR